MNDLSEPYVYITTKDFEVIDSSGVNIINENQYENTANNQTIYVRVKNNKTNCINDSLTFDIIINPLPDFMVDTPVILAIRMSRRCWPR